MSRSIVAFAGAICLAAALLLGADADAANETRGATHPQYRGCNLVGGGAQGECTKWAGANLATRSPGKGPQTPRDYEFVTNADVDYLVARGMNTFGINANADVIIGFAFWEYGPEGWSGNVFDLRQSNGADNARMKIIRDDFVDAVGGKGTAVQ